MSPAATLPLICTLLSPQLPTAMPRPHLLIARSVFLIVLGLLGAADQAAASTLVRINTTLGPIDLRLFDTAAPASVANFLNYVQDGDYNDSFIHRAPPGFVIQGGGHAWPEGGGIVNVPTDPPVVNEPGLSNLRGTLAYAKLGNQPNSATSGWFLNVGDNSANLDFQNGGFTVFGNVIGDGLAMIDLISQLRVFNATGGDPNSPFGSLPVLDTYESGLIGREHLLFVESVGVGSLPAGDYNFDGVVNLDDYQVWRSQLGNSLRIVDHQNGNSPSTVLDADGNGDGVVNAADYTIWRDSFQSQSVVSPVVAAPEPASLAALGWMAMAAGRRRAKCGPRTGSATR